MSKTEVANIKAKNATMAFPLHVLSSIPPRSFKFIFPLLFLRCCDFLAYRAQFTASYVRFVSKKRLDILSLQDSTPKQRLQGCLLMIG